MVKWWLPTLVVVALFDAALFARSTPPARPHPLGGDVTATFEVIGGSGAPARSDVVPLRLTLWNHGRSAIWVGYRDVSLSDRLGERSMSLLPGEIASAGRHNVDPFPLDGPIPAGEARTGVLYFRLPSSLVSPVDLRIDLEGTDHGALGRDYLPLRADAR
jgi:hypothetical protein